MRPNHKHNPFLGSLRAVAIAIGKRDHINIQFQGTGAKTDGNTIYLPASLPSDDEEIEVLLRGFLDHEVGHVKHTDFAIPNPPHRLIHTITNIVEDIRIEQLMGQEYPGCAINLRELVDYMKSIGKIQFKDKTNATGAVLMALSYGARVKHLRNNLTEEAEAYRKLAEKHLGNKALSVIDNAIAKAGSLISTQESRELAQEVYELLKQVAEEPPPPQPQQSEKSEQKQDSKDQQQGEGQGGNGESKEEKDDDKGEQEDQDGAGSGSDEQEEGDDKNNSSANDGGEGNGDQGAGDGADGGEGDDSSDSGDSPAGGSGAGNQPAGDDTGSAGGKSQPGPTRKQRQNLEELLDADQSDLDQAQKALDVADQAAAQINKDSKTAANEGRAPQADSSGNTGEVEEGRLGGNGGGQYIQEAAQKTVGLRGKLAGLFQSTKLKRDNPQLTGHKLDRRAIHRVAAMTPDTRIFQRRREKVADNTAIAIVVDRSGSMRTDIGLATASAYSVAKATESMPGVKCAVAAFPNARSGVIKLKDFSEKPKADCFAIGASGGTPLDVALRWAGQKLWPRQENRKMVLVLTDGDPDSFTRATDMISLLKKHDIECYGIGIGSETSGMVKALFGDHAKAIASIEELATAMFDTITAAMVRR